jgi:hypothetical protein
MVAATLRTIFAQPDRAGAQETIARISRLFERRYPKLVAVLQEAEVDILVGGARCRRVRAAATCRDEYLEHDKPSRKAQA